MSRSVPLSWGWKDWFSSAHGISSREFTIAPEISLPGLTWTR